MKVTSKKDWWLTLIVWGAMLFSVRSGLYGLIGQTGSSGESLIALALSVVLPLFILWIWLTTYYILDERDLIIRFGPFKKVVPLHTIKSVKKTMNPLSSPALSLKRLEIVYGQYDRVLISPPHREEFMKLLAERCPQAKIMM